MKDEALLERIVEVYEENRQVYGYPRIHETIRGEGIVCGRNRIARIMRENGIVAKIARRFRRHSHLHGLFHNATNLLLTREPVDAPGQVWVGDTTYIRVGTKWTYLSAVMDLYTREIIGWSLGKQHSAPLVCEALRMAYAHRPPEADAIFHSDQGTENVSNAVRDVLAELGLRVSISRKGHCWDNAYMESFFHTLKTEMVHFKQFSTLEEAIAHIMDYLRFYNRQRIHSGLGYLTPQGMANLAA